MNVPTEANLEREEARRRRPSTALERMLDLMRRPEGATAHEICVDRAREDGTRPKEWTIRSQISNLVSKGGYGIETRYGRAGRKAVYHLNSMPAARPAKDVTVIDVSEMRVVRGPTLRGKITTVVGVIPAKVLVLHHHVPHRDPIRETGYQRRPAGARITQLAREIRNRHVDLPTSVLLNLRSVQDEQVLTKNGPDNYLLCLDPEKSSDDHRLFVVDGQHRIRALQRAIEDGVDVSNIKIPFVCMIGADEMHEMKQFHVVNSNAKSVPTDLAFDLLKARAESDPDFARQIEERGKKWEVDAQGLTKHLAKSSSTWKGCIRLPNTAKGDATVPSASFVKSLKPLLTQTALFQKIKPLERQAQAIDAYWRAIRRVLPETFENPAAYSIQKGVGVTVLHRIFPIVLDLARSGGDSIFEPASYEPIMDRPLKNLQGLNGEGITIQGAEFWRTGRAGAVGSFSSLAGYQRLAGYLQAALPELDL